MTGPVEARILVVDDEAPITELVGMALRYEGFAVAAAATGREALTRAAEFQPDLVVLGHGRLRGRARSAAALRAAVADHRSR